MIGELATALEDDDPMYTKIVHIAKTDAIQSFHLTVN